MFDPLEDTIPDNKASGNNDGYCDIKNSSGQRKGAIGGEELPILVRPWRIREHRDTRC